MPAGLPPAEAFVPVIVTHEKGTIWWRLHQAHRAPDELNPTVRDGVATFDPIADVGGRFDSTAADPYAYLYAAADTIGVTAEVLLRDRPSATPGFVRLGKLAGLVLSALELRVPLDVVVLHGRGLTAIGQDAWLTASGPDAYGLTREWARAIRRSCPICAGFEWRSRLDNDRIAAVFFGDRCPVGAFQMRASYPIDPHVPSVGLDLVRRALRRHRVVVG